MEKLAVITGAGGGIGHAVAECLLRDGTAVLAVDRDAKSLQSLEMLGAEPLVVDLAEPDGRDQVLERGSSAHYLVNAAGIIHLAPILEVTVADLRRVFTVNVEATWDLTARLGGQMEEGGSIVNLSSSSAKLANTTEVAAYACSKAAILSATRSFAYEFASVGVRVNAVCPGVIDTAMQDQVLECVSALRGLSVDEFRAARNRSIPLGRAATPAECSKVIRFLLSDDSSYMTGQAVNVTGGLVTW